MSNFDLHRDTLAALNITEFRDAAARHIFDRFGWRDWAEETGQSEQAMRLAREVAEEVLQIAMGGMPVGDGHLAWTPQETMPAAQILEMIHELAGDDGEVRIERDRITIERDGMVLIPGGDTLSERVANSSGILGTDAGRALVEEAKSDLLMTGVIKPASFFDPLRLPPRDARGMTTHPDFAYFEGHDDGYLSERLLVSLKMAGFEVYAIGADLDGATDIGWFDPPPPPTPGDWRMASIHTHNDAAVAWFVRSRVVDVPTIDNDRAEYLRARKAIDEIAEYLERVAPPIDFDAARARFRDMTDDEIDTSLSDAIQEADDGVESIVVPVRTEVTAGAEPVVPVSAIAKAIESLRAAAEYRIGKYADGMHEAAMIMRARLLDTPNVFAIHPDGMPKAVDTPSSETITPNAETTAASAETANATGETRTDDKQRGLYDKYEVRRADGSDAPGGRHHGCGYFVLDLDHDPHARAAIAMYAASCEAEYPQLAADLRRMPSKFTQPIITDAMVERAARAVAAHASVMFDSLDPFTRGTLVEVNRAALLAALNVGTKA